MGLDKFSTALDLLIGFKVNLYVGEEVFYGKLIGVEADHVVLETERKYIFYYSIAKIQAITKNTKQFQPEKTMVPFQKTKSLTDLLHSFQHAWVTILCINKQQFSGVLSEIDTDFATLINGEERILIKLTHISNILKGFIKEEEVKNNTSKEKPQNKEDAKNIKTDSKEEATASAKKTDSQTEKKSMSAQKDVSLHSEKQDESSSPQKKNEQQEAVAANAVVIEENKTLVWSQPIKTEAILPESHNVILSNMNKSEIPQAEECSGKAVQKASTETKKPNNEMSTKDKKAEETKLSNPIPIEPPKDSKSINADVPMLVTENKPAPPLQLQRKEVKPTNLQEKPKVEKSVTTQNQEAKKTEKATKSEANTKSVWKQKDQEMKALRFSGEPDSRDNKRAFPFAGWPNRNNRATRF